MSFGKKLFGLALLLALIASLTLPIDLQPVKTEPPVLRCDGGLPPPPSPWVLPSSTLAS